MIRAAISVAVFFGLFGLAACQTTEGFGRDVQSAGHAITKEAEEAQ